MDFYRQAVTLCLAVLAAGTLAVPPLALATAPNSTTFSQNLQLWDSNPTVLTLQQFLNAQKYLIAQSGPGSPGDETTFFGLKTYKALKQFQAVHGLPATGFLGPLTRGVLTKLPSSIVVTRPATPPTPPATPVPASVCMQVWCPSNGYSPGFGGGGGGDRTAPVISNTPTNTTAEATSASGASVSYTNPTATDNVDGTVLVSCSPASGSTFALGTTAVTCSATDRAGNSSNSSFNVHVQDTTSPTVSLTAPSNGATITGSSVALSATAADSGGVVGVQFKVDGLNVGAEDTSSPYSITLDSTSTRTSSPIAPPGFI